MSLYTGGRIGSNNDPTTSVASGLWAGLEQCDAVRREIWPGLVSSIITDDLVVHLDAGDSASYPGSGTTWTDLSGNEYDGTLNGPTFVSSPNHFSFDGANDRGYVKTLNYGGDGSEASSEGGSGNYEYYDGDIAQLTLYNKALTAAEVTQNFDAIKGRYGL